MRLVIDTSELVDEDDRVDIEGPVLQAAARALRGWAAVLEGDPGVTAPDYQEGQRDALEMRAVARRLDRLRRKHWRR